MGFCHLPGTSSATKLRQRRRHVRPGQTKRGCEFLGLRILENIRRDWLTLAPDRLNRHDAISSKIARTELALTHCHARARGLRRRRDLQRDLHA